MYVKFAKNNLFATVMNIPKIVAETAEKNGYDLVEYLGTYKGADAFYVGVKSDEETPCPTGLPSAILFKDGVAEFVSGLESLELLNSFE